MAEATGVRFTSAFFHHSGRQKEFMAVIQREKVGQVLFHVEHDRPSFIARFSGLLEVEFLHGGYGSYRMIVKKNPEKITIGKHDPTLDPISSVLLAKGWDPNHTLAMHYDIDMLVQQACHEHTPLVRRTWTGEKRPYVVASDRDGKRVLWCIRSHLKDFKYFKVHVVVPDIYHDVGEFTQLLEAMKKIPTPDELEVTNQMRLVAD